MWKMNSMSDYLPFLATSVLNEQPEAVQALMRVWYQTLAYRTAHLDEVLSIEAKQAGVSLEEYNIILKGFKWLTPEECLKTFKPGNTMGSVVYASRVIGEFMLGQKLILVSQIPSNLTSTANLLNSI